MTVLAIPINRWACHTQILAFDPFYKHWITLDKRIAPLIFRLWEAGASTWSSCQGGEPDNIWGDEAFHHVSKGFVLILNANVDKLLKFFPELQYVSNSGKEKDINSYTFLIGE